MSDQLAAPAGHSRPTSRRRFLELAGTAGAASLLTTGLTLGLSKAPSLFAAGGNVEALVLNCMDFRLANELTFFMTEHGLVNKYDQMILAGATLAVATDKYPAWAETFWDHLELAIKLHGVKRVIAVNHRDCGAFKLAFGKDFAKDPKEETEAHTQVMVEFRDLVKRRQPSLDVELLLMYLDGHVQVIADGQGAAAAGGRH